jgi:hypothetical protein
MAHLRIGTWNLEGRWGDAHLEFVVGMDCDVLLLTEVSESVDVPGHALHLGEHRWRGGAVGQG